MISSTGTNLRAAGLVARERLERHGVSTLSDAGLLTILAGPNGSRAADAVLDECKAVQSLPHESAADLARLDGVTPRAAAVITAAVELGRRTLTRPAPPGMRLGSPREAAAYLLPEHGTHPVEKFGIVSLNTKHVLLRTAVLSSGIIDASLVHSALVFRVAATHRAAAIICFHNHPSGDPTPSGGRRRAHRAARRGRRPDGDRGRRPHDPGRGEVLQLQGDGTPVTGVLNVAGRILRLDPSNRDALSLGSAPTGSPTSPAPKNTILKALDRTIALHTGAAIPAGNRHDRPLTRAGAVR